MLINFSIGLCKSAAFCFQTKILTMATSSSVGRKGSRYRLDNIPTNTFTPRTYQVFRLNICAFSLMPSYLRDHSFPRNSAVVKKFQNPLCGCHRQFLKREKNNFAIRTCTVIDHYYIAPGPPSTTICTCRPINHTCNLG